MSWMFPKTDWLMRFVARLLELKPSLTPTARLIVERGLIWCGGEGIGQRRYAQGDIVQEWRESGLRVE